MTLQNYIVIVILTVDDWFFYLGGIHVYPTNSPAFFPDGIPMYPSPFTSAFFRVELIIDLFSPVHFGRNSHASFRPNEFARGKRMPNGKRAAATGRQTKPK